MSDRSDGNFEPQRTLDSFRYQARKAPGLGFPQVRFVTHMEWALEGTSVVDRLLEYEARANEAMRTVASTLHSRLRPLDGPSAAPVALGKAG